MDHRLLYFYNEEYFLDTDGLILPQNAPCAVTDDKRFLNTAKGVAFHVPSLTSQDILNLPTLHNARPAHQRWFACSQESAANYPLLDTREYLGMFDYEVSYRQYADVWHPYLDHEILSAIQGSEVCPKTGFCAAFISSNLNHSFRKQLLFKLMEYMPVDSFGDFARNKILPEDQGNPPYSLARYRVKLDTIRRYKFTLAFENSISVDYVTEKFFHPLMAGSIPVYYGAPNVDEFSPGDNAYINARDFKNSQELAGYLQNVDESQHHEWRNQPLRPAFLEKVTRACTRPFDAMCKLLINGV